MDIIATAGAPKAIGPYSQAIRNGNLLFTSGQISLDPATGELVTGDFDAHVHQVFKNLRAILAESGVTFANVVKATVYLTDLGNFQAMNAIYAQTFGDHKPARTTVQVSALPKGAPIEIDLIAAV